VRVLTPAIRAACAGEIMGTSRPQTGHIVGAGRDLPEAKTSSSVSIVISTLLLLFFVFNVDGLFRAQLTAKIGAPSQICPLSRAQGEGSRRRCVVTRRADQLFDRNGLRRDHEDAAVESDTPYSNYCVPCRGSGRNWHHNARVAPTGRRRQCSVELHRASGLGRPKV
jgi:hypothetical protein